MPITIAFTPLVAEDHEPIARLLHQSLVHWYESRLGQGARFGDSPAPFRLFPQVYEALDAGECVTARDADTGEWLGVCFSHERETHIAVGIVSTLPTAGGKGIARKMVELVLAKARQQGKPARLVSSLLNLDSFSLYTRLGFIPGTIFQDLLLTVPTDGMAAPAPVQADQVRLAHTEEAGQIADLEFSLQGIRREKDLAFFLRNEVGSWRVLALEHEDGSLTGYLALSTHESFCMIGPGCAEDEAAAAALLWRALDEMRGRSVVFLLPCSAAGLVRTVYAWGARNVELHVAQSTQPTAITRGVVFPTFLPESA